jgi:hypothetical protein
MLADDEVIIVEEQEVVEKKVRKPRPVRKTGSKGDYKEKVKVFLVRTRNNSSLYEVYFTEGGEIPKVLKDLYTSQAAAKKAIKHYEATRKQYY